MHSHTHVYPIRYPDKRGSSHQQQVTCYSFKDVNNWWIVKRPRRSDLVVSQPVDAIRHGDVIQLVHGMTSRALNSHDVAAPMSPQNQEVSCYIDYNVSMPAQNLWRVDIINRDQVGDIWHTIESLTGAHHSTNCILPFLTFLVLCLVKLCRNILATTKSVPACTLLLQLENCWINSVWEIFDHPPYSPDLAPSDFHLFTKLKDFLGGTRFGSDEELKKTVNTWLNELAAEEYNTGILKLVNRYDKCLNVGGDYVRFVHVNSSQALKFSGRQLPDWGFNQHEIVTDRILHQDDTVWNVEEHRYTKNEDQKDRERELVNAEMIPLRATTLSFWEKFIELQYKMLFANQENVQNHMYSSEPLEWPLMARGIAYWVSPHSNAQVHLLGNLVVWLSGSASIMLYCVLLTFYLIRRRRQCFDISPEVEKLLSSSLLSKNLKVRIYKTIILPVVLYGCETWTLTLREELRLRVFENKVLRKIFGAKRDEVTGEWSKLHNTELHALYSSSDIIRNIKSRRLRWAGDLARIGESRNAYRVLVGRPEGKRPLGRPRRRWEDNIKMDLREVGYDDREWINLAQDRDRWRAYVRVAMNLWVP
ncbi:hypothetical protein ANN_12050 [Periplaneta americana]|uniref:MIR domain-containing protein n=1 Tax=Periplaneta americana TaxID=6978 RepID=A0ABQ8T6R2_PERAM|nr:hypothetical protein ANN_12050 [Periplaneta americana]